MIDHIKDYEDLKKDWVEVYGSLKGFPPYDKYIDIYNEIASKFK